MSLLQDHWLLVKADLVFAIYPLLVIMMYAQKLQNNQNINFISEANIMSKFSHSIYLVCALKAIS